MGTSKSYDSPKWPGVNDQVGDAASDGLPTKSKLTAAVSAFTGAYREFINSGTSGDAGYLFGRSSVDGRTVGGRGGGGGATARSRAAVTGARLGRFISSSATSGLGQALESLGFKDLEGKTLEEVLDAVLNRLCEDGGLLDDSALTEAMARTLDELAEDAETIEEFDELLAEKADDLEEHLQTYFTNVLAINFEQKEGGFVREKVSQNNCDNFFTQARELIRSIVAEELSQQRDLGSIDWSSQEAISIADAINQEVLNILIDDE